MSLDKLKILRKVDYTKLGDLSENELKLYLLLLVAADNESDNSGLEFETLCRALGPDFDEKELIVASRKFAGLGLGKIYLGYYNQPKDKGNEKKDSTLVFFKPEVFN